MNIITAIILVVAYCVIPAGYPAGDEQPKDKWKPENIHYDKW